MKTRNSFKPALAAKGKSIGGASRFIRDQIAKGTPVAKVKEQVIKRWPKLATKAEKPFLAKRIQIAKQLAAHQHADN